MSYTITLNIPDEIYTLLEQAAHSRDQTLDHWLIEHLPYMVQIAHAQYQHEARADMLKEELDLDEVTYWEAIEAKQAWLQAEWTALEQAIEEEREHPLSLEEAAIQNRRIFDTWCPVPLSEEESIELALSEEITENENEHGTLHLYSRALLSTTTREPMA